LCKNTKLSLLQKVPSDYQLHYCQLLPPYQPVPRSHPLSVSPNHLSTCLSPTENFHRTLVQSLQLIQIHHYHHHLHHKHFLILKKRAENFYCGKLQVSNSFLHHMTKIPMDCIARKNC